MIFRAAEPPQPDPAQRMPPRRADEEEEPGAWLGLAS